jgi:Fur family iron response transcriptional regulator
MTDFDLADRPASHTPCLTAVLRMAGLRPTRQRVALAELLFGGPHRHVSAEQLHSEASDANVNVSLATIYNTLHQFHEAGLLREVAIDASRSYFDTDTSDHHHFFVDDRYPGIFGGIQGAAPAPQGHGSGPCRRSHPRSQDPGLSFLIFQPTVSFPRKREFLFCAGDSRFCGSNGAEERQG